MAFTPEACSLLSQRQSSPVFSWYYTMEIDMFTSSLSQKEDQDNNIHVPCGYFGGKFRQDRAHLGWYGCRWEGRRKIQIGYGQSPTKYASLQAHMTPPYAVNNSTFWQVWNSTSSAVVSHSRLHQNSELPITCKSCSWNHWAILCLQIWLPGGN